MTLTDNLEGLVMLRNTEVVTCGGRLCGVHVMIIFEKGINCHFYLICFMDHYYQATVSISCC
jgi:hypothetical protein